MKKKLHGVVHAYCNGLPGQRVPDPSAGFIRRRQASRGHTDKSEQERRSERVSQVTSAGLAGEDWSNEGKSWLRFHGSGKVGITASRINPGKAETSLGAKTRSVFRSISVRNGQQEINNT